MRRCATFTAVWVLLFFAACSDKSTPPDDPPDNQPNLNLMDFAEFQSELGAKYEGLLELLEATQAKDSIYNLIKNSNGFVSKSFVTDQGINIIYTDGSYGGIFMDPEDNPTIAAYSEKRPPSESSALDLYPRGERAIFLCPVYSNRYFYADSILSVMRTELSKTGFPVIETYLDENCGVEQFRNIENAGILHIYTHSLAWPKKSAIEDVYIMTGDTLTQNLSVMHSGEFEEHTLACMYVPFKGNVLFMNQNSFSSFNNFYNNKTFLFLSFGYASTVDWLTDLRFGDGAGCCLGYDWRVFADSNLYLVTKFYSECCDTSADHELMIADWFLETNTSYIDLYETTPPKPHYCNLSRVSDIYYALWHSIRILGTNPDSAAIGDDVTINGVGFGNLKQDCRVTFSGIDAEIERWLDAKITVTIPDGAVTGDITVYPSGHKPISYPFIVFDRIILTSLSRNVATYRDTIEVYGTGFGNERGNGVVLLDDYEAEIVNWAEEEIAFIIPDGLWGSEVQVRRNGAKSNNLFINILALQGISPEITPYGSWIELYGPKIYGGQIFLDTMLLKSETDLQDRTHALIPYDSKSGWLRILRFNVFTNPVWLTVIGVDSIRPNPAGELTPVVIHGGGFGTSGSVTFEDSRRVPEIEFWTDDSIGVITPKDIHSGPVIVERSGTASVPFEFLAFRIEELDPDVGGIGDTISIIGESFLDYKITNRVMVGEIEGIIRYWSDTLVWMEVPPYAASGLVHLEARGQTSNSVYFTLEE